jgi:hypothetical protein
MNGEGGGRLLVGDARELCVLARHRVVVKVWVGGGET